MPKHASMLGCLETRVKLVTQACHRSRVSACTLSHWSLKLFQARHRLAVILPACRLCAW